MERWCRCSTRRRDFDVTVEGYGDGYLAVLVAA